MFQDYTQEARKTYKRQMRQFQPDLEAYEREKVEAVMARHRDGSGGGLEIVETEDGELMAVDREGRFYATADSTEFVKNRPKKEAVDRLVNDIRKAEQVRLKKRRERGNGGEEDGDITYINEKVGFVKERRYLVLVMLDAD